MKKTTNKLLMILLCLSMLFSLTLPAAADGLLISANASPACPMDETCPLEQFTDTVNNEWYHDGIHYCIENGLMDGATDTTFAPDGAASRAMIVSALYRLEGEPAFMNDNVFSDVASGSGYEKAVVWANGKGIVTGYGNGKFGPEDPVTREQLATILCRYAKFKEIDVSIDGDTNYLSFDDVFEIKEYAKAAMFWTLANNIIEESDGCLYPSKTVTRAEAADMILRYSAAFAAEDNVSEEVGVVGGWTVNSEFGEPEIPEEALKAFNHAMEGLTGANHTPVAYLGSQVVAGINYAFLCKSTIVAATPITKLNVVEIYRNLQGEASIRSITELQIADYTGEQPVEFNPAQLAGGWTVTSASGTALPENVQTAFDKATGGLMGVKYSPLACLGSQVVAGQNFAVLCKATSITAEPATALAVMIVYADLSGGAQVTSISGFSFH